MAFDISKIYTEHPLMDEICYNCKLILKGIVIKNDVLARNNETENSLQNAEVYSLMHDNNYVSFAVFPFSKQILMEYGFDESSAEIILKDKYTCPEEKRDSLTDFANEWFKEHFEEENNYYRTLMGLPPYNTGDEYYIWLTEDDIPKNYTGEYDLSKPLHMQPKELIAVLYSEGIIDSLREVYVGSAYSYMLYLGSKSIDLYIARKAAKWDILYMPNVYYLVEDKFTEVYKVNREIYANKSYQEFFSDNGEYYDQMMILIVLSQTFADLITDVPEWYIRRDIFDIRSCQYFLESYGVSFFREIPLKYQIRIVKNVNKLIKYKSSNQNNFDIIDIFGIDNITIYKYWLYKKRNQSHGKYEDDFDLEFVASEINDSYDNYITDSKYITPYDDITYADEYWDGKNSHEYVKGEILKEDFTIKPTKYMSIEYHIPMDKYLYQQSYLLGLFLRSEIDLSDITIGVPSINDSSNFKIRDLFLYLVMLTNSFNRSSLNNDYTKVRYVEVFNGSDDYILDEDYYDWMKEFIPEIFANRTGRVNMFNPKANIDKIDSILFRRISHNRFGLNDTDINGRSDKDSEYFIRANKWIDEIGYHNFINPSNKYTSIDDLLEVYYTNTEIYNRLVDMISNADNKDDKRLLQFVYDELFTAEFDRELYKCKDKRGREIYAPDLIDLIRSNDYVLYKSFNTIIAENNSESRKDMIRSIMNDVISTLEYYIKGEGLEYLFTFTSTDSFSAIVHYIYLMINFFKSYKVHFLDPYITYESKDKLDNDAKAIDKLNELRFERSEFDKLTTADDVVGFNIDTYGEENAYLEQEVTDIYAHYEDNPELDYDYNGYNAEDGEAEGFDTDGGYAQDDNTQAYITVNGGASYEGISEQSLHDLDGGNAEYEYTMYGKTFADIDGGFAFDMYDFNTDAMGSQKFTYDIDGSGADGRRFYSNTMYVYLIGTELFADVIVSKKKTNKIQILDDGLYLKDEFVETSQFNNVVKSIDDLKEKVRVIRNMISTDNALLLYKYEHIDEYIQEFRDKTLYNIEYVLSEMEDDKFVKDNTNIIDSMVNDMVKEINATKAFTWENIN